MPSGETAEIRKGKGRDLMRAQRAAGAAANEPGTVAFALIAELTRVGGKPIVYEDVLEMELDDVLVLQEQVLGGNDGNFQGATTRAAEPAAYCPPQPQSPDSSRSDSGSAS